MSGNSEKLISQVICDAQEKILEKHSESLLFGLGVNDPKRVFGTTSLLEKNSEIQEYLKLQRLKTRP